MKKLLLVIDMQNDFIDGSLGTPEAQGIVPAVQAKIEFYKREGYPIIFTRDTHTQDYLKTQEGQLLPILHCLDGTQGHKISSALDASSSIIFDKPSFGSLALADSIETDFNPLDEIEICGLCTDICVVSNALILKAKLPETVITVDAQCCAGVTVESHQAALLTMKMCQVNVINYFFKI